MNVDHVRGCQGGNKTGQEGKRWLNRSVELCKTSTPNDNEPTKRKRVSISNVRGIEPVAEKIGQRGEKSRAGGQLKNNNTEGRRGWGESRSEDGGCIGEEIR